MLGTLHPIDSENIEVRNESWNKENSNTANSPTELLSVLSESHFQPEQINSKQWILLQDA